MISMYPSLELMKILRTPCPQIPKKTKKIKGKEKKRER